MRIFRFSQGGGIDRQILNKEYFDIFTADQARQDPDPHLKWSLIKKDSMGGESYGSTWFKSTSMNGGRKFTIDYAGTLEGRVKVGVPVTRYKVRVVLSTLNRQGTNYSDAKITLIFNPRMSPTMSGAQTIASWNISGDNQIKNLAVSQVVSEELGISEFDQIKLPHEENIIEKQQERDTSTISVRITRKNGVYGGSKHSATSIELNSIYSERSENYYISYNIRRLENDNPPESGIAAKNLDGRMEAELAIDQMVKSAKGKGYVDSNSPDYIPSWADQSNWDFNRNESKEDLRIEKEQLKKLREEPNEEMQKMEDLIGKSNKMTKKADDFSGFYSGAIPQYTPRGSSVDASQILSMFSRGSEAIELVKQISPQSLEGISSIFNFANKGAFGVYVPKLDVATKTEELKKQLESIGYQIEMTEKGLTAFPKEGVDKTNEEIEKDISRLYDQIKSTGGSPIGIDVQANINAAKKDDADMRNVERASNIQSPPDDRWEWLAILHLASTIVHEAAHAHGAADESPADAAESAFISRAISIINQKYKSSLDSRNQGDLFRELIVTQQKRKAHGINWYKFAQMSYYAPPSFFETPIGSDIQGRFPKGSISKYPDYGIAGWSMMAQQEQNIPIEKKLGRQYMSPLPRDLDQANDIMENQLRKFTRGYEKNDPHASMTELLSDGYDEDRAYTTLEGLLDEKRPKPIILPIKKSASKNIKVATLFGWMNNLAISDGNTIPGLGDRVMAWDDRDEDFAAEEDWIKQQPRYNPSSYDLKGFYQRWIEPRFKPEFYDDMTRDYSNVHPAKRFASTVIDNGGTKVLSILSTAKEKIISGEIGATRFIATNDIMPLIEKIFASGSIKISVFYLADIDRDEQLYSVWVCSEKISEEDVERVEKYLQGKNDGDTDIVNIIESVFGIEKQKKQAVKYIIGSVKGICKKHGINGVYISGEYPRLLATKLPMSKIESLDFGGGWNDQIIRVGTIVAEQFGNVDVRYSNSSSSLSFTYKDINVSFNGIYSPKEIKTELEDRGIDTTPFNLDIYNKDFTINMLTYDIFDGKIRDVTGLATKGFDTKTIETYFDSDYVCANNPMIIFRAIKLHLKHGFKIDEVLSMAMKHHVKLLSKYSDSKLLLARENVLKEGKIEGEKLLKEFGLE